MRPFLTQFCARIQQRWVFAAMGSLAVMNGFTMRTCLSVAITKMVKPRETSPNQTSDEVCPAFLALSTDSNLSRDEIYEWDEYTQGIILSSFYWGYIMTQIPGGLLSEKFGGKYILGGGIFSAGLLTLLTPIVVKSYGSTGLILLRFVMGFAGGTMFPAVSFMIAQWAPPLERTKISTFVMSGMLVGTVLGNALTGVLIQYSLIGWPVVFHFFGACAVLWFFAWVLLCYNHPDVHPFIAEKEKEYLREAMFEHTQRRRQPTPWRRMMTSGPLWALVIGYTGFSWGFLMMISDLPKYMSNVLRFSIQVNGFLSAIPHILTWVVSNVSSWPADWLIKSNKVSRTTVRKVLNTTASVLTAIFLVVASYAGCDRTLVSISFILGMGMMGFFYPSIIVNLNDLSPNFSGTISALMCTISGLAGVLAPYVVGVLTPNQTVSEWRIVFWITFAIFGASSLIFGIWGDGEVQHWNNPEPRDQKQVELENGRNSALEIDENAKSQSTNL